MTMSKTSAQDYYNQQAGDPDDGYITPDDAQASVGVIYDDHAAAAALAALHLTGTGAPTHAAPPGSTWLQTDSTTDVKGWLRWIKASGTGSTGWVAGPEADTGWRDVTASLINGWEGWASDPRARLRRVGNTVFFEGQLNGDSATNDTLLDLPSGWRPASSARVVLPATDASAFVFADANGYVDAIRSSSRSALVFASGSWLARTTDAWPSSLPGSGAFAQQLPAPPG